MNAMRKMLDFIASLLAILRAGLQGVPVLPGANEKVGPRSNVDPDFPRWIVNDPMATLNPASRYGDEATGFLGGSERDQPERSAKDD